MSGGLSGLGRYSEPALLILVSLSSGPKHGYAITQDVDAIAGVKLGPGTLYGALARLERLGLIDALPADDRRRPYKLSNAGMAVLRAELDSLRRVAEVGLQRLAAT
jgi:DNA-binding PadR family transcriptional regulator